MFENAEQFGVQTFTAIVMVVSAAVASHIMYGYGTKRAREAFVGIVLGMMFCYQLYYLVLASQYIPADHTYMFNESLYRSDCRLSDKGGKRPGGREKGFDFNPCFCHAGAECTNKDTGVVVSTNNTCPTTGGYSCFNPTNALPVPLYTSNTRNCKGGQGVACTKDQPCDPCGRESLVAFGRGNGLGRCTQCATDFRGACNFVPNEGPYCRVGNSTKAVEPCRTCCTEPATIIIDGVCY
jgi:hypothetical protein